MSDTREPMLVRTFLELNGALVGDFDVIDLLTLLADRCVEVFDIAGSGLMLGVEGDLEVVAATSNTTRVLEEHQLAANEGPCLECYSSGTPVAEEDLARAGDRWPSFAPHAVQAGFLSVQALPMRFRRETIGALNLFHTEAGGLSERDVEAAQAFADVATTAILQYRRVSEAAALAGRLQEALESRVVIEQAKGMVAEQAGVDVDRAFDRLRAHSRNHNVPLSDVSAMVVNGELTTATLDHASSRTRRS